MPWVRRHRRSAPFSFFRTTTVRSHYRRPQGAKWMIPVIVVLAVLLLLVVLF